MGESDCAVEQWLGMGPDKDRSYLAWIYVPGFLSPRQFVEEPAAIARRDDLELAQ